MTKFRNTYRIESNRWDFWDYSSPARYFITICTENRVCVFGDVENGKMKLSEYGKIVYDEIRKLPTYHKRIVLDEWIVMPNHIHLIIQLGHNDFDNGISTVGDGGDGGTGTGPRTRTGFGPVEKIHEFSLPGPEPIPESGPPPKPTIDEIKHYRKMRRKMLIPKFIGKLQMLTSKKINLLRKSPGQKNWQSNYHDHVIRDNDSYKRIKHYIINNPKNWKSDSFNDCKT